MKNRLKVTIVGAILLALLAFYEVALENLSGDSLTFVNTLGLVVVLAGLVVAVAFLRRASLP